ncbi:MAG: PD-(D/E)XK nuclease family protein [Candidatus Eremiobacteraeota bacterium]|nr:PD-(D/E)XK nuclease family protein [Candidatus Eremiobacteraeota bacterium]
MPPRVVPASRPPYRAAVSAALWQAHDDRYLLDLSARGRSVLTDDLCRYLCVLGSLGVSDVDLARAAADAAEAPSRLLRALYGARLILRAAGVDEGALDGDASSHSATNGRREEADVYCADLASALTAVRAAGEEIACAPRALVEALSSRAAGSPVARMLEVAGTRDSGGIVRALSGAPYLLDPAELALAVASVQADANVRETLVAVIGALSGGRSREAAVAALDALDAAIRQSDDGRGLATAAHCVERAMREFACARGEYFTDTRYDELRDAATRADPVWAAALDRPPLEVRVASLVECIAQANTQEGVALVVDDGGQAHARLVCGERAAMSQTWRMVASSLGLADAPEHTCRHTFWIARDIAAAVSAYIADGTAFASPATYAWPPVEPPVVFTAPPMTFSASRLNAYVKCPRRWFFDYLCQVLDDPSSLQAAYGSVIHDALESFHRSVRVPSRHDAGIMLERLQRELDTAFGNAREAFPSQLEYEVSRARARRIAEQYVRWLVAEAARAPMQVEHVELMQRFTLGGHEFVGYIDRVDRPVDGGAVTILDYKTGRIDTDAVAYLEKVRSGDEAQLALYYAMRTAAGDDVHRIALVSVRDPRDEVRILALDIDEGDAPFDSKTEEGILRARCSRADLEASLDALVARCDTLTKMGQTHFAVGADPPCGYCAYYAACRERPREGERIFAR